MLEQCLVDMYRDQSCLELRQFQMTMNVNMNEHVEMSLQKLK